MDNRPIGIFDSGLGGLTAVMALRRLMPEENIVYFSQYNGTMRVFHSPEWTLDEFKEWFRENKPTIQYELATPVVKTVDLSILDQNENKVSSISSFNDTTHITASSETIPPIFEGYLATKEG